MEVHRPRSLGWPRAAALLYGDWGTSKAYVIGLAFAVAGFGSLPIILAVCALSLIVGLNYIIICKCFPSGGGVYSAARPHGRLLAVVGALMLIADFTVTAALSTWAALSYLNVPGSWILPCAIAVILLFGVLNYYGPHHSGTLAVFLAAPVIASVVGIIAFSLPHLTFHGLELPHVDFYSNWVAFTGVILALSGVEAIATLTGVLKQDKGSTAENPRVVKNAAKAIVPVALEVSAGTALLAWAVLSLPHGLKDAMLERKDDILRFTAEHYAGAAMGPEAGKLFWLFVGVAFAMLLFSAVNTAVAALIGLMFRMSGDNEMPRRQRRIFPPSSGKGLSFSNSMDSTMAATLCGTVTLVTPLCFCPQARRPSPMRSTHMTKKSASGLVCASVSQTAASSRKVAPMTMRGNQPTGSARLNAVEPRSTTIAPTTPMA
ncbi:MAG: APC family permease [Chthoniobacterales bacterium]